MILWFVVLYIIIAVSFFDIPFYKLLEYFLINESEPYMLKENQSTYTLVSSTTAGKDELIKRCKVYTIFKSKVYLIRFTAQDAILSNYIPVVKKMIDSFEEGK